MYRTIVLSKDLRMKPKINSKKEYHQTMVLVYELMNKGEKQLSAKELKQLAELSLAVEQYEDAVLGLNSLKAPKTITEIVELKMFEHKMTQAKLAEHLGVGKSKVSEIMNGKRKPDIGFLKGVHRVLNIDAGFLLEHA